MALGGVPASPSATLSAGDATQRPDEVRGTSEACREGGREGGREKGKEGRGQG